MKTFCHILLEMDPDETDFFVLRFNRFLGVLRICEIVERDCAAEAERHVVLADLVVLRHVRIEIILPVEFADRADFASEHQPRKRCEPERLLVHDGQRAGKPEANRADMCVRLGSKLHGA